MTNELPWLQDFFFKHRGEPLYIDGKQIIQLDRINIPPNALIHVKFVGDDIYTGNAAVIAVRKPGKIFLSDGSAVTAVAIWDERHLPREVTHIVEYEECCLEVYNKYYVEHLDGFVSEDNFTGNAGMHVIELAKNVRRYECSSGVGPFALNDLVFELRWEPFVPPDHKKIGSGPGKTRDE
jgi:hypothetical protein